MLDDGPIPGKTFEQWLDGILPEVLRCQGMLADELSRDPSALSVQATLVEDAYTNMSTALSEADAWLDWLEYVEIMKIDRELKVAERNIVLKAKVLRPRMLRDKIKGLTESLKSRMRRCQWRL